MAAFYENSSVELFHNGSKKFETLSDGVNITGTLKVDGSAFSGGSTVQCQQGTTGTAVSLSTTYADTGLSCSITTQKANSKILVHVTQSARGSSGDGQVSWSFKILRGSTVIFSSGGSSNHKYTYFDDDGGGQGNLSLIHI